MGFLLLFALFAPLLLVDSTSLRAEKAPPGKVYKRATGEEIPPYDTVYYFDQLIDHNNASRGTFKQRYWHTAEFYEPGGPILLTSPGESNAERYTSELTNSSLTGFLAQTFHGATVMLEHRFYGLSNPVKDLEGSTLAKYHTIEQAVGDLEYFVENVQLSLGVEGEERNAPWIVTGCSYMGALAAWTMKTKPGLFHAGWSSSAPVQPIFNFWRYFEPIREYMPKNCSADVEAVISHVDDILGSNNKTDIRMMKDNFGMSNVTTEDFVAWLTQPLTEWQDVAPSSGPNTTFGQFCDALEVDRDGEHAPAVGWGFEKAFKAWGEYTKKIFLPNTCGKDANVGECLNTNTNTVVDPKTINTTIDNEDRSWQWVVCNEVGWHQVGAPPEEKTPRLVSRYYTTASQVESCKLSFPDAPTGGAAGVNRTTSEYGGWDVKVDRMVSVVGKRDPWREATLGASSLHRNGTDRMPIIFAEGGTHCSDMSMNNGVIDSTIGAAITEAVGYMKVWMDEWKSLGSDSENSGNDDTHHLKRLPSRANMAL
ncbi:hypothetical protein V5O48_010392 [Marasmius crinis-equi]|uniref:Serine peptidase n=1 Tax=Marasmius crinis-equi TaxID=585013 RepID=A0ABR3F8T3_9AGAR